MIARIFSRLKSWLSRKAERIEAEYQDAQRGYMRACHRGDTRAQHETWLRLRAAMTARLQSTVQNRGIGWRGSR